MTDLRREFHDVAHLPWPWEPGPGRVRHRWTWLNGGAWPLLWATVAVLASGYGWLGSVVDGVLGAAVGCAAGLVSSAFLYLLVDSAVSGRSRLRRRGRTGRLPRHFVH